MNKKEIEGFLWIGGAVALLILLWLLLKNRFNFTQILKEEGKPDTGTVEAGSSQTPNEIAFVGTPETFGNSDLPTMQAVANATPATNCGCGPNVNNPGDIGVWQVVGNYPEWLQQLTDAAITLMDGTTVQDTTNISLLAPTRG